MGKRIHEHRLPKPVFNRYKRTAIGHKHATVSDVYERFIESVVHVAISLYH
jgi:hypothetical protein